MTAPPAGRPRRGGRAARGRAFTAALAGMLGAGAGANAFAGAGAVDADGVQRLFPSAPGFEFHLGAGDPNRTRRLAIEQGTVATARRQGALAYWNVAAHDLDYASGGAGQTARLHIHSGAAGEAPQRFTWRTQRGYLSGPADLRNQEFTAYARVHGITDPRRAALSLKIRGGAHSARAPDEASCVMLTFQAPTTGAVTRFGKELVHPQYDYVKLTPSFPAGLIEDRWFGLKLVSYAAAGQPARVVNRLYVDADPFDGSGRPRNQWRLLAEYVDVQGASTGHYARLVDWGGWLTTLRTDGVHDLDVAILSAREIAPPR
jgi:hypothetical protein